MFGIKLKEKPAEEKTVVEENKQEIIEEEIALDKVEQPVIQAQAPVVEEKVVVVNQEPSQDKFSLAGLLGKTESGMKTEFYAYQIKELMQSVVKVLPKKQLSVEELDKIYNDVVKYGGKEILVTPYFYSACRGLESKYGYGNINFSAITDYPYGESSFKARIVDVKEGIKNGIDLISVVMPSRAYSMGALNSEKARLNKLCKIRKGKVGIALNINYDVEDLRKIIKVISGLKCEYITLLCENCAINRIVEAVNVILDKKFDKKIYVYSAVSNVDDLSKLLELKVSKVYTENFEAIGRELERKFEVEL